MEEEGPLRRVTRAQRACASSGQGDVARGESGGEQRGGVDQRLEALHATRLPQGAGVGHGDLEANGACRRGFGLESGLILLEMAVLGAGKLAHSWNSTRHSGLKSYFERFELGLEKGTINHSAYITMLEPLSLQYCSS